MTADAMPPRALLLADFNCSNLAGLARNHPQLSRFVIDEVPYGQVVPTLLKSDPQLWQAPVDCVIVWTRAEAVSPGFQDALDFKPPDLERLLSDVDAFAAALLNIRNDAHAVLVTSWIAPPNQLNYGLLDWQHDFGLAALLQKMNLRLASRLSDAAHYWMLDTQKWITTRAGSDTADAKLWYMGKIPFGNATFQMALEDIAAAMDAIRGQTRKLLVVDLDDTLWGGTVGDDGWQALTLGGHHAKGEAYVDFQRALKALTRRGVLLGISSKNDESTALEAIDRHPEMVLRRDDFAGWRINWEDKARNLVDLAAELNIGLQSMVFLDDNPVERARVRDALPEVLVPEWPPSPLLFRSALARLRCFDTATISKEDTARTAHYATERQRGDLMRAVGSLEDWWSDLGICVNASRLEGVDLARTAQLLNKTNQMNLATRRMTTEELWQWLADERRALWVFRVSDRLGDSGLTGIASVEVEDAGTARIVDFVLSCRVMGRRVEEAMLHVLTGHCRQLGVRSVSARYLPTAKNGPCLQFWTERSGFDQREESGVFAWNTSRPYPLPGTITLVNSPPPG